MPKQVAVVGAGMSGLWLTKKLTEEQTDIEISLFERQSKENYSVDCANGFIDLRNYFQEIETYLEQYTLKEIGLSEFLFYTGNDEARYSRYFFDNYFHVVDRGRMQKSLINELSQRNSVRVFFGESKKPPDLVNEHDYVVDARGSIKGVDAIYGRCRNRGEHGLESALFLWKRDISHYLWVFPQGNDVYNVGYGDNLMSVSKQKLNEYISELGQKHGLELEAIEYGGGKLDTSYGKKLVQGQEPTIIDEDGVIRVGDRLGIVDPLFGEGIGGAISSARSLAEAMKKDDLDVYEKSVRRQNNDLGRLQKLLYHKQDNYKEFMETFMSIDGIDASLLSNKPKLFMKHPIKATKFLIRGGYV